VVREPIVPEFTGEEYLRRESAGAQKYELDFLPFAGEPLRHNEIALATRPSCATFAFDVKTRIGEDASYYADVVVVEVLSPSTQTYDRIDDPNVYRKLPSLRSYGYAMHAA
jgi:hypothetical protein